MTSGSIAEASSGTRKSLDGNQQNHGSLQRSVRTPRAVSRRRQRAGAIRRQNYGLCYLSMHYQLLPENRLATLMADLFGVKVATATIARMSRACAERLHGFVETRSEER